MGKLPLTLFDTFLRLSSILLIWGALFLIFMLARSGLVILPALLVGFPAAFLISHFILLRPFVTAEENTPTPASAKTHPQAKGKRAEDDLANMFHLLDEDDRYDIQQRIKERLMERIDENDADFGSFADLLNDRPRQKRS